MVDLDRHWPDHLADAELDRARLLAAYADPSRGYHDVVHLTEVLHNVEEILDAGGHHADRDAVLLAAWFHDAVYDAAGNLEERSARLAEQVLGAWGTPDPVVAEVARLVRLTATHAPEAGDVNGAVLCDADLAILAADPDRYREYVDGVRREYAHVSETDFRAGRATVLRALAAKTTLFHTTYGREHWETPARANLARELDSLSG
jgi:predicted metal-dependent HD superfamily phosphohydrolase